MTLDELIGDVRLELELMAEIAEEAVRLAEDVAGRAPTVREKTAAGAFLAQLYSGVENILKRLCRFHGIETLEGGAWHRELFDWFRTPSQLPLPALFDDALAASLAPYRRFRHVVRHSYGLQLDWDEMERGLTEAEDVFERFRRAVLRHLDTLSNAA